ncbi:MAG: threonine-phosphate decarboxylase [SAR324 cluster bacterium]|uniref:threonine-phosphate decarboxylase n=1 Tax=SAR324 cluster bacterium TaxID=2024889 RepID=A0A2A4T6R8_9DELT|nr:MAG: threonine-phosphate decarboxylase [SAR324 cluster bacterium]
MKHIHGGVPTLDFQRLGITPREVIDFSVNISPLGVPEPLLRIWNELSAEIGQYPTIEGQGLLTLYEEHFQLDPRYILPGNGSIECIYLVPRVLGFKKVGIITPSFFDYERASRVAGASIVHLPLQVENAFAAPDLEEVERVLGSVDALILGNPNNPTGTFYDPQWILDLADRFPQKWLLIDEAFIHFLENHEEKTLARQDRIRPNILVFQSLTKFYALPGLRLGCVIGAEETIQRLREQKEPWSINRVAEKAALQLAHCEDYEAKLRKMISQERKRIQDQCRNNPGIHLYPSTANFFLAQWKGTENLDDLLADLLSQGLYVRDCRNFKGLEANFFRFAIRTPDENTKLLHIFNQSRLSVSD